MLITCEKCQATYALADQMIGKNGRKVKCARCAYIWMVLPEIVEEPMDLSPCLEDIHFEKPARSNILVALAILLFMAIMGVGLVAFPETCIKIAPIKYILVKSGIYYDSKGIALSEMSYHILKGDLIITGKLTNHSNEDKIMPNLRYILLNKDKKAIFTATAKASGKQIKAYEESAIYAKITNLSNEAAYLELVVGNKPELSFDLKK